MSESPGPTDDGAAPSSAWHLPQSQFFSIEHTPRAGRCVVARTAIPADTLVLATSPALSPVAHTLFRTYRREVCAWCFAYDRGRSLSHRSLLGSAGVVFCSADCSARWLALVRPDGLAAHEELARRERTSNRTKSLGGDDESTCEDTSVTDPVPSQETIDDLFHAFELFAENAKQLRQGLTPVRDRKKTLQSLSSPRPHLDPDNLRLLLSGILHTRDMGDGGDAVQAQAAAHDVDRLEQRVQAVSVVSSESLRNTTLPYLQALANDSGVYKTRSALTEQLASYVELVARMPLSLLPHTTLDLCHEIVARASHNAFSIRPAGGTDGEQSGEYFGWGIWPEASFFNHSCTPNLRKVRQGRIWCFNTSRDVSEGEALCITYLGGDENDLAVGERRARLMEHWGFECQCSRCISESNPAGPPADGPL